MTNQLLINTQFTLAIAKALGKTGAHVHTVCQFAWDNNVRLNGWTKTEQHAKKVLRAMLDKGLIVAKPCVHKGKKSAFITLTEQGCAVIRNLIQPKQSTGVTEDTELADIMDEEVIMNCCACGDILTPDEVVRGQVECASCTHAERLEQYAYENAQAFASL